MTTINNAKKVLPSTPALVDNVINTVNEMEDIFTSPLNKLYISKRERKRMSASTQKQIPANKSCSIFIDFKELSEPPFFIYSLQCKDRYFLLNHYIYEVTKKHAIIVVENNSDYERNVVINFYLSN